MQLGRMNVPDVIIHEKNVLPLEHASKDEADVAFNAQVRIANGAGLGQVADGKIGYREFQE